MEDIGFGDTRASILTQTLNEIRKQFAFAAPGRTLFFVYVIRYLCSCEKDRSSDMMRNIIEKEFNNSLVPVIRNYMPDMHTRLGQEMGRDVNHFLKKASKVIPEKLGAHKAYLNRLLGLINREKQK